MARSPPVGGRDVEVMTERAGVGRYGGFVAETEGASNLVPPPVDVDLFSTDTVLVEAARRHGGQDSLDRLAELGRLAGAARSLRWAEFVDRHPPTLRTHDACGR